MNHPQDTPRLQMFCRVPARMMEQPPLCSSLQNFETSFFLIALNHYPHALLMCASAIESAIKAALSINESNRITAEKLFAEAQRQYPGLRIFDKTELDGFRFARNRIAHYGFSPNDDEETAGQLLRIGIRLADSCYREFFGFEIFKELAAEFSRPLSIALECYAKASTLPEVKISYCFLAFGMALRWSIRESLMAGWESHAASRAEEIGTKHEYYLGRIGNLETHLHPAWRFDCPICDEPDAFVCEMNNSRLDDYVVELKRGVCACCDFVIPPQCPFLADALCQEQIPLKLDAVMRDLGIAKK